MVGWVARFALFRRGGCRRGLRRWCGRSDACRNRSRVRSRIRSYRTTVTGSCGTVRFRSCLWPYFTWRAPTPRGSVARTGIRTGCSGSIFRSRWISGTRPWRHCCRCRALSTIGPASSWVPDVGGGDGGSHSSSEHLIRPRKTNPAGMECWEPASPSGPVRSAVPEACPPGGWEHNFSLSGDPRHRPGEHLADGGDRCSFLHVRNLVPTLPWRGYCPLCCDSESKGLWER